jgi:hypothetical protein
MLERKIEKAIADVVCEMGLKQLPLLPTQQTMHLMAKAATAVYESAVENWTKGRPVPQHEGPHQQPPEPGCDRQ